MKEIKPIKVSVNGNYSNIETRQEFFFKGNYNEFQHIYRAKGKKIDTIIPNHYLFQTSKPLEVYTIIIGSTTEIENGFIPSNSIKHYFKNKVFKKREFAEDFLKQQYFDNLRKICFDYLDKQQFYYSINYLEGMTITNIAKLLQQQWKNRGTYEMFLKIAKIYKK
jgi:hypothetical protein